MTNEQIFIAYLKDIEADGFTKEWVMWMLEVLRDCNSKKILINPEWLDADYWMPNDSEPIEMIIRFPRIKDSEPSLT